MARFLYKIKLLDIFLTEKNLVTYINEEHFPYKKYRGLGRIQENQSFLFFHEFIYFQFLFFTFFRLLWGRMSPSPLYVWVQFNFRLKMKFNSGNMKRKKTVYWLWPFFGANNDWVKANSRIQSMKTLSLSLSLTHTHTYTIFLSIPLSLSLNTMFLSLTVSPTHTHKHTQCFYLKMTHEHTHTHLQTDRLRMCTIRTRTLSQTLSLSFTHTHTCTYIFNQCVYISILPTCSLSATNIFNQLISDTLVCFYLSWNNLLIISLSVYRIIFDFSDWQMMTSIFFFPASENSCEICPILQN